MKRPRIGVNTDITYHQDGTMLHTLRAPYAEALWRAGGIPLLIPSGDPESWDASLDRLDGLPSDPVKTDQHGLLFDPVGQPQASYLAAVSLINSERFEEAIQTLRLLLSTLGPHPDVLNYLGYSNRRLGHFEKAQRYYEQALAIDPKHRGANEYLGEMWVELGRSEEARARLSALEDACPFGCVEYEDLRRLIERRLVAAN